MEGDRAAGKGARELRLQDGLALLMGDCQRRDGMVVFLRGLRLPGGDGGQALIGVVFITDNGVGCEACRQRCGIAGVFKLDIEAIGGRSWMDMVPPLVIGVSSASVQFFPPRQFLRRMASLSPEASAGKQGNWLRTVPGKGYVASLRLYSPTAAAIIKSWKPSDIEKVNAVVKWRGCVAAASRHLFYAE